MNRLSEFAVSKRSVTLLLAGALFIAGISAWGSLKQELLPDIEFPVITVIAPYPGAGSQDVADQVAVPDRARHLRRAAAEDRPVDVGQLDRPGHRPVRVRHGRQGSARPRSRRTSPTPGLPENVEPTAQALNINASPVIIASIAATSEDGLEAAADIARTEIIPELTAIEGVSRADVTGGLEQRLLITLDPDEARRERRLASPRSAAS